MTYVYLMNNHKELTFDIIQKHVDYLKKLDDEGKLVLCGPFADFPGEMVVFNANSREEAVRLQKVILSLLQATKPTSSVVLKSQMRKTTILYHNRYEYNKVTAQIIFFMFFRFGKSNYQNPK